MRALVVRSPNSVELAEVDDPIPAAGEILIRPCCVGMCGTDLEIIDGRIDPAYVRLPITVGHEWSGVVLADGSGTFPAGTRVVGEGIIPCDACDECEDGNTNRCRTYDELGFTRPGAAADYLVAPSGLVHAIADDVSFEAAALVEPAAVVYRALSRVALHPGARVLVVGDGTIGLLTCTLVRLWSPARVDLLGAREPQRQLAVAAGADTFTTAGADLHGGYDLVVEAAGVAAAVESALGKVGRGGTLLMLGLAGTSAVAGLPIDDVVNGDICIIGSFGYTRAAWAAVVGLLNEGQVRLDFLVTDRFAFEDWASAIARLRSGEGVRGKVLLELPEQPD